MSQAEQILNQLKYSGESGVTNVYFNNEMHIFRYGARIMELRRLGHDITSHKLKGGMWKFVYHKPKEPIQERMVI